MNIVRNPLVTLERRCSPCPLRRPRGRGMATGVRTRATIWTPWRTRDQFDADSDGYGNACDGDLDGSGRVTTADHTILRNALNTTNAAADLNHDGSVTAADLAMLESMLNHPPGPSGLHP